MPIPPEREVYRPSGRLSPHRFATIYFLALIAAILIGGLLCIAWHTGTFFLGLTPLFAGLALAGTMFAAVHTGHCRNPIIGAIAGAFAGTVAFLAAFQFDLAFYNGWSNLLRLDRLPDHIQFRVENDGAMLPDGRHQPNEFGHNLAELLFNAAIVILIPIGAGWRIARRPFCEIHERWMDAFTFTLTVESAEAVIEALRAGDPAALRAAVEAAPSDATEYVKAEVLYVPRVADSSAYLTLSRVILNRKSRELDDEYAIVKRWLLSADEAAEAAVAFRISDAGFAVPVRAAGGAVPLDDAGMLVEFGENRVFNERTRIVVAAMIHVPVGICVALGLGCFFAGLGVLYLAPEAPGWVQYGSLPAGFAFLFLGVGVARFINVLPSRILYARLCREIRNRPDAIVQPDDPDAVFVEVVPRRNWVPKTGENADDFGLLRVDRERGLILFEGGAERWAIPAVAMLGCEVIEYCAHAETGDAANIPILVLTANVGGREWERPICARTLECRRQDVGYRRAAMDGLHHLVRRVLPRDPSAQPSFRGR